jgi:ABC-type ATPase with predicted acetyltransferase domain
MSNQATIPEDRGMRRNATETSSINQPTRWRIENREQYNKLLNDYYHKNKDKINAKIECNVCGVVYTKSHKASHCKSKFHIHIKNLKESYGETF